jgi:hypothetical protein
LLRRPLAKGGNDLGAGKLSLTLPAKSVAVLNVE